VLYNGRFSGFRQHPNLAGTHAFLSASQNSWVNYTEDKLIERLSTTEAAARGTRLHAWAAEAILLGRRQPEEDDPNHDILCRYINDALDLGMIPEQVLMYSMYAYGTADTIGFEPYEDHERFAGFLRIHDYKSGKIKTSEIQLYIYAAFFCLEYGFMPFQIEGELRIYQGDKIRAYELDRADLSVIYEKIKAYNRIVEEQRMGGLI
jgi:hypothetical protein